MAVNDGGPVATLGQALEARLAGELGTRQIAAFEPLLELRNLGGEATGYVRTFTGERLAKGASLSIDIAPGLRYFNIHLMPDPAWDAPRYLFEGMLSTQGSQVSMDLFPDFDVISEIDAYLDRFAAVAAVYERARQDPRFALQPSRLLHMRAFSSPVFLLVTGVTEADLPAIEAYGEAYFDAWLDMLRGAPRLPAAEAARRQARRRHVGEAVIRLDPDRHRVVEVYGEATTQAIEAASVY